jgi:Flp pilus assembly protein CpaB
MSANYLDPHLLKDLPGMADSYSKNDALFPPSAPAVAKRAGPNISSSWIIMVLSFLIAVVVYLFVTNTESSKVAVAVASKDISTGAQLQAGDMRQIEVTLDSPQLNRLVLWADRNQYVGYTVAGPIAEGDMITKAQVRRHTTANGLDAMSIPVDKTRAVGGDLTIGDRIDVINNASGTSEYAAQNIEVIAVNDGSSGGALSAAEGFHIIVAVTPDQAISIAKALDTAKIDVVRTTGGSAPSRNSDSAANFGSNTTTSTSTTSTTKKP